jgi:hypothetical protein
VLLDGLICVVDIRCCPETQKCLFRPRTRVAITCSRYPGTRSNLETCFFERQQTAPNATWQPTSSFVALLAVHCDHTTYHTTNPSMGHPTATDDRSRPSIDHELTREPAEFGARRSPDDQCLRSTRATVISTPSHHHTVLCATTMPMRPEARGGPDVVGKHFF